MTIINVADFWKFSNNFHQINYMDYQFFLMKNDILPIWEAPENRNGGAISVRVSVSNPNLLNIWEDACLLTINGQICVNSNDINDINGLSFNLKNNLTVIKIWNGHGNNDISKKI